MIISSKKPVYLEKQPLAIHLTVTGRCQAKCEGCINRLIPSEMGARPSRLLPEDTQPERDARLILYLAKNNPGQEVTLCFYGGEPFLALEKMTAVWRRIKKSDDSRRFRFMIYTGGEFFLRAQKKEPDFMKDIWLFSVSIDGDREQHERIRKGTSLKKIHKNLKGLKQMCAGHVLFWSTLREHQSLLTCFQEFLRLKQERLVDHMFWHWAESREPIQDFNEIYDQYQKDLEKVVDIYIDHLKKGELLSVLHINELILYLLSGKERQTTACGVENSRNYDIVSGQITPCADLPACLSIGGMDESDHIVIRDEDLSYLVDYKEKIGCHSCESHFYCGGRCPVQFISGSEERTTQICRLMHLFIQKVRERLESITNEFESQGFDLQHIYDQSAYLAGFTDVVP